MEQHEAFLSNPKQFDFGSDATKVINRRFEVPGLYYMANACGWLAGTVFRGCFISSV